MSRDNFSFRTREVLAKRVGFRCSNPSCQRLTVGPQKDPANAINLGVAAHISAASPGGKRYDATISKTERVSADNGIWLCQNCAKLIDSDEATYSENVIRLWKLDAEERALRELLQQQKNGSITEESPAEARRRRDLGVVRSLLENIDTNAFDDFVLGESFMVVPNTVLEYQDAFRAIADAPSLYIYDRTLANKVSLLSAALLAVFSYGDYFWPGVDPGRYVFGYQGRDSDDILRRYCKDLVRLRRAYTDFIKYVKHKYLEIDIVRTNAKAVGDYIERNSEWLVPNRSARFGKSSDRRKLTRLPENDRE